MTDDNKNQCNVPLIDPTKNVETRIDLATARLDDLRIADEKLRDYQVLSIKEFVGLKTDHLKEVQDLHQRYNDRLEQKESERLDAKALAVESQLTIERERGNNQAMLLAKTVEQNASKVQTDLETSKKEQDARFLRVENTLAETKGKSGVTDPLIAGYMEDIKILLSSKSENTGGKLAMREVIAYILAAIAIGGFVGKYI